ncbi:hypothetical protein BDV35DRAFT_336267 [Aspergillus flavus]|uniref:Uncharacterized protein n=1 Tax=Aspergillus flavus TaxID=5059 RepID=A0A5N6HDN1_ASPFL|nr:hypothetical protein BDV35DRAFT_336267 [Aspergillus flavus]
MPESEQRNHRNAQNQQTTCSKRKRGGSSKNSGNRLSSQLFNRGHLRLPLFQRMDRSHIIPSALPLATPMLLIVKAIAFRPFGRRLPRRQAPRKRR